MIRDALVARLIGELLSTTDAMKRDAANVLVDLFRTGMNDTEIMAALDSAAERMSGELLREVRAIATALGIIGNDVEGG